ncbi:MAG: rhodanese-like domain-containing protein [Beijerinckiaceae bacterium]
MYGKIIAGSLGIAMMALTFQPGAQAANVHILDAVLNEKAATNEVSTNEMRRIMQSGGAIVVDTRSRAEFEAGHIPGAKNLDAPAAGQLSAMQRMTGGDKTKPLVLYCNGPFCQASRRLADKLVKDGYINVRRYQLGMPVWRALGGQIAIETGGLRRIVGRDATAVLIDVREREDFRKGTLPNALNAPVAEFLAGKFKKLPLPEDDFNRRIVIFGASAKQARSLADFMTKRPWHNVVYFNGAYADAAGTLAAR